MADLELTRAPADRRLYVLDGIGRLRFERRLLGGRRATAEAHERRWQLTTSLWRRAVEAADEAGAVIGTFDPRAPRRGGAPVWGGGGGGGGAVAAVGPGEPLARALRAGRRRSRARALRREGLGRAAGPGDA